MPARLGETQGVERLLLVAVPGLRPDRPRVGRIGERSEQCAANSQARRGDTLGQAEALNVEAGVVGVAVDVERIIALPSQPAS